MSRKRKRTNNQIDKDKIIEIRNQIAQKTRRAIVLLVSFLLVPCLILIFKIGEAFYSSWIVEYRTQIIGFLLLAIIVAILSSPLIIEVNSNSRPLSGPGDRPSGYF